MSKWRERAACRGLDTAVFFPDGKGRQWQNQAEKAKRICLSCPVMRDCAQYAADMNIEYGVYGGRDEFERTGRKRQQKPPMERPFNQDRLEQITRLVNEHYSSPEIAIYLRISERTVVRYRQYMRTAA